MAESVNWALRWPGRLDRAPRPRPGPAASLELRATPRCSAATPAASPRPARGVPRRRPGHRSGPGQGRGRSARSRHWGLPPRSAGNCPPPARTCRCRTALCRGPPARCARPAPLRRHARVAGQRQPDSPGLAGRGPDGTTCNCRLPGPAAPNWHADLRRVGNRGRRAVLLTYVQILPSGAQPASCLSLAPFRGLRYAQDRVSGIAEVTSPPYDVIAHDTADHLLASDPHNVVRLILPRLDAGNPGPAHTGAASPGAALANGGAQAAHSGAAYDDAARLLRDWQAEGILVPDPEPTLYVYEQSLPSGPVLQRGLIGALQLAPLGAGPVHRPAPAHGGDRGQPGADFPALRRARRAWAARRRARPAGRGLHRLADRRGGRPAGAVAVGGYRRRDPAPALGGDRPGRTGRDRGGSGLPPGAHRRWPSS